MNREDSFSGTWKLNPEKSRFDPNHRPMSATMYWERTAEGYSMKAEGINSEGQACQERPQRLIVDGHEHPVPDAPGVTAVVSFSDSNTIQAQGKSAGRVVGNASYVVSEDGDALTATVSGVDAQKRPFHTTLVWDRQQESKEVCP
jgi:hypothetical protein